MSLFRADSCSHPVYTRSDQGGRGLLRGVRQLEQRGSCEAHPEEHAREQPYEKAQNYKGTQNRENLKALVLKE